MATRREFVDDLVDRVGLGGRFTFRSMFGEYALYVDGKVVGFACDDSLFVKPSAAAVELAPDLPQGPPYPGAKDYPVADELLDDPEALRALLLATAALMAPPKPKRRRGTG